MTPTYATPEYLDQVDAGLVPDAPTYYALKVVSGEIVAGPNVRLACQRHLDDLREAHLRGYWWDLEKAQRVINFFPDVLRLVDVEGEEGTEFEGLPAPFYLQLWQAFIVGSLFGWVDGPAGQVDAEGKKIPTYRRFRAAYIEIGKGNGKTPLVAGIGMYMLTADGEKAPECYTAATKLEQAKILFRDAERMTDASPQLSAALKRTTNNIACFANYGFFRAISSEKRGLDGPRVHFGALDELHEHPDATVANKIRAGTKGRKQSLIVEITNSGHDRTSLCWDRHEYSIAVLNAGQEDAAWNDRWFTYICGLDDGDDWMKDEGCWAKANPNLGVSITWQYLREQVNEARGMPSKQSIVARLNFCEWVGAEKPWISFEAWQACEKFVPPATGTEAGHWDKVLEWLVDTEKRAVRKTGAADLSAKIDLTALANAWLMPDGSVRIFTWFYTPAATMESRAEQDRVPYPKWAEKGWIEAVPGEVIDYSWPAETMLCQHQSRAYDEFAFDNYRFADLEKELLRKDPNHGIPLVRHNQGFSGAPREGDDKKENVPLWMPRSVELIEECVLHRKLEICYSPVLRWNSANAVLVSDEHNNRKFDKRKATGRIDGLVAVTMAIGALLRHEGKKTRQSAYETQDLVFV